MKIEKIVIKNFRSLNDVEVNFYNLNAPISIIWENNAGKSNVIKSILWGLGYKYIWEDGITESDFYNQDTSQKIVIDVSLDDDWMKKKISFSTQENYKDIPSLSINGNSYWKKQKDPIVNKIFYYDFQQVANLLKIKTDFSYTPLGKIVRKIKDKFKNNKLVQDQMNEKIEGFINKEVAADQDYQKFKNNVWEKLKKNLKNHSDDFDFKHTIQDVDKIINWLSFFVKESAGKPLISVENFGSGFRSLLVFSIFEAISESGNWGNIYIFEEPETFLHENFEEYFFELLKKLAVNNQVIITTHSKKFVDVFNVWSIIRLHNNESTWYATKICQKNLSNEVIKNINEGVLVDDNNNIILNFPDTYWSYMKAIEPNIWLIAFSEKILIVEWPHDVLAYKTAFWKGLLEKGYVSESLGYLGLNIVCVHNKDLIWPLMYICQQLETKAFIVFDSDLPLDQEINLDDDYFNKEYKLRDPYLNLDQKWKQHYTKTVKLVSIAKKLWFNFQINRPKIEEVLNFEREDLEKLTYKNKSSIEIYNRIKDFEYVKIKEEYPKFITPELESFIYWEEEVATEDSSWLMNS